MPIYHIRQFLRCRRKVAEAVYYPLAEQYLALRPRKLPPWKRWLVKDAPSLQGLEEDFCRLGRDARVKHVILTMDSMRPLWSHLGFIRQQISELRQAGKTVVVWAKHFDLPLLYTASAADHIYLQYGAAVSALGRSRTYLFFKDALESWGLRFDAVAISPFKSAADMFTRSTMSDEVRQMTDWLMDSEIEHIRETVARGRGVDENTVQSWLEQSPFTDVQALDQGIVDGLVSQEELAERLGQEDPVEIADWSAVRGRLCLPPRRPRRAFVGVVPVKGDIVDGESQEPPLKPPFAIPMLTRPRAGDKTVVQQIRRAEKDRRVKAVLLYIASGGGSASASEAMHSALTVLAKKKPVIVYMDGVAASGGYYIAAPARWIVAHPAALTGSIGVLAGRFVIGGLLRKRGVNYERMLRGSQKQPGLDPMGEEERHELHASIERIYDLFIQRVTEGRNMDRDNIEQIAGGRVWTGQQAYDNGLVDQLGTLRDALQKAKGLAGLSADADVRVVPSGSVFRAPHRHPKAVLAYALEELKRHNSRGVWFLTPLWCMEDEADDGHQG